MAESSRPQPTDARTPLRGLGAAAAAVLLVSACLPLAARAENTSAVITVWNSTQLKVSARVERPDGPEIVSLVPGESYDFVFAGDAACASLAPAYRVSSGDYGGGRFTGQLKLSGSLDSSGNCTMSVKTPTISKSDFQDYELYWKQSSTTKGGLSLEVNRCVTGVPKDADCPD